MTGDIRKQLAAALDEAEKVATAALLHPTRFDPSTREHVRDGTDDGVWHVGEHYHECEVETSSGEIIVYDEGRPTADQALHIARWDPSTVLRLIERDRALVDALSVAEARDAERLKDGDRPLGSVEELIKAAVEVAMFETLGVQVERAAAFWLGTPEVDR